MTVVFTQFLKGKPMPTITHPKDFSAERAWGALDIATFDNTSVRLHWTDQPYLACQRWARGVCGGGWRGRHVLP